MLRASVSVYSVKERRALFSARTAHCAISQATARLRLSASEGAASRRSSSSETVSALLLSGTRRMASFSSRSPAGSSMAVQRRLNTECATAMPARVALSSSSAGARTARTMQNTLSSTATPMTLNSRWTTAARRAFLFVPTEESMAVTVVPMFCPMMMGMAAA